MIAFLKVVSCQSGQKVQRKNFSMRQRAMRTKEIGGIFFVSSTRIRELKRELVGGLRARHLAQKEYLSTADYQLKKV